MGNILGWTSTGDIAALQKMLDHVNHTVEEDFESVQELSADVKREAAALEQAMTGYHNELVPSCKNFTEAHEMLFHGVGGQPALADDCLQAQGHMKTMLGLDMKIAGCANSCWWPTDLGEWAKYNESVYCNHGPCGSTLRCVRQLETLLLKGSDMSSREGEVMQACNTQGFQMFVPPPIGLNPSPPEGAGANSLCAKAAPAQSSMLPVVAAASMLEASAQVLKGFAPHRPERHGSQVGQAFL